MLDIMKQLAIDAMDRDSLSDFYIGTVMGTSPLVVYLDNGLELTERFLVLAQRVTVHEERGQIRTWTTTEPDRWNEYRVIRQRGLHQGERVILVKANGGQQYLILDRLGAKEAEE